jgi:hypothetical protein
MDKNELTQREKNYIRAKSITNYAFGIFIIAAGVVFCWRPKQLPKLQEYDPSTLTMMGVLCFVYGAFRLYRGYAKNYFN